MANRAPGTDTRTCSACGSEIDASARVCPDCGATQDDKIEDQRRPNRGRDGASPGQSGSDRGGSRRDDRSTGGQQAPTTERQRDRETSNQHDPPGARGDATPGESTTGGGEGPAGADQQGTSAQPEPKSRLFAAGIGALVSVVLGWVPLVGPVFGGAAAGYLRGSDGTEGAISGLLGNAIASVPLLLLVLLFLALGGIGAAAQGDGEAAVGMVLWLVIFAGGFAYFYALGALGGLLGAVASNRASPK